MRASVWMLQKKQLWVRTSESAALSSTPLQHLPSASLRPLSEALAQSATLGRCDVVTPLSERFAGGLALTEIGGRKTAHPQHLHVLRHRTTLRVAWCITEVPDGVGETPRRFQQETFISAELLRTHAPSTDVAGAVAAAPHAVVYGKRGIRISDLVPIGNYALRIAFSDGHTAGIYGFDYLYALSCSKFCVSREYIRRLRAARRRRDPPIGVKK